MNKTRCLTMVLAATLVCSLSSVAVYGQAKNTWIGVGPDLTWNNGVNWSLGHPPLSETAEFAQFDQSSDDAGYPCIIDDTHVGANAAMCQRTNFGLSQGGGAHVVMTGGELKIGGGGFWINRNTAAGKDSQFDLSGGKVTVGGGFRIGDTDNENTATMNMSGGEMTVDGFINMGNRLGIGELWMTAGTLSATGPLQLGTGGGKAKVFLDGGVLEVSDVLSGASADNWLDFRFGTLVLQEDDVDAVKALEADGHITAWEGKGTLVVAYDPDPNVTTVTGLHPWSPQPTPGVYFPDEVAVLTWQLPATAVSVDILFGTDSDPASPTFDFTKIVDDQAVTSVPVSMQPSSEYHWQIVMHYANGDIEEIVSGPIVFTTNNGNRAPDVAAGEDTAAFLPDGTPTVDVPLSAALVDDEVPAAAAISWTVVSQPDEANAPVTFIPAGAGLLDIVAQIGALGTYEFKVEATDGEYSDSDTIVVQVFTDGCAAAKAQPDYEPLLGDLDGDCDVDEDDLAILMENMGKSNALEP